MSKDEAGILTNPRRQCKLSIVIPAYNEEGRIGETLDKITGYFTVDSLSACTWVDVGIEWDRIEIIVVDDGSTDGTCDLVEARSKRAVGEGIIIRLLRNGVNRGKGFSVKQGVLAAGGDYILFSDADLSTPIGEAKKLIYWLSRGYDVVIGSRALAGSRITIPQPLHRRIMGRVFNHLVQLVAIRGIQDTQCGFKAFTREAAQTLFPMQRVDGFAFDVEILYLARQFGFKIKEVPVEWRNSQGTRVRAGVDSAVMFCDLLRIRRMHMDLPWGAMAAGHRQEARGQPDQIT
ncbi:MAG TPA: glycosyltransferase family 2 protein [Firmicutes bacterium]|nr:glycosyltransferase family 2 protein [Bacillota bacterium]